MPNTEALLKIEHFYNDEDADFHVSSKGEVLSILRDLALQGASVALYYGGDQNYILSTLLSVNEDGLWLDAAGSSQEREQLLRSDKITFVSVYHQLKIQFVAQEIENDVYKNNAAFYLELPDYLLRIQRRDFFRTDIPADAPIKCIIPTNPKCSDDRIIMREVHIVDISCGGVGLLCDKDEEFLLPKKIFRDCQLTIPDIGNLRVTIEVRNGFSLTSPDNVVRQHVGCRFIRLDTRIDILLQRYITQLQSKSIAARGGEDSQ